jgi:hypothetical protein
MTLIEWYLIITYVIAWLMLSIAIYSGSFRGLDFRTFFTVVFAPLAIPVIFTMAFMDGFRKGTR